jgi:3-methyladenine DNA glycosylase AlkD
MTLKETLKQLESLGNEKVRAQNSQERRWGQPVRRPARRHPEAGEEDQARPRLAMSLWETGNVDAQFLATLLIEPKKLSAEAVDRMVRSTTFVRVADWLNSYVVAKHPDKEALRRGAGWPRTTAGRPGAGWHLTAERVAKNPDGLDLPALLDRIESEMAGAAPEVQWTMNNTLAAIGIHVPKLRKRAIAIGEKLGIYRDYPVSKGCTSPFAPIWINAMVSRQS